MPTVLRVKQYRFYFFSKDCEEPAHVHVERGSDVAKFWINPIRLERSRGFNQSELREIEQIIEANQRTLLQRWAEHCRG